MDILERYERLTRLRRWSEALPLIEDIVNRAPAMATSWFNYGVCLDELGRHREAAERFLRAYELEPEDYGAQYRAFRSLFLAQDWAGFLNLAERECSRMPELVDTLVSDKDFGTVLKRPELRHLAQRR